MSASFITELSEGFLLTRKLSCEKLFLANQELQSCERKDHKVAHCCSRSYNYAQRLMCLIKLHVAQIDTVQNDEVTDHRGNVDR